MPSLSPEREHILVQLLKSSQTQAFSDIFSAYYTDMVRFAFSFTGDQDASEDIVQEVFLKLWEGRGSLVILTTLKSYLFKSVQNSCIDRLRHNGIKNRYASLLLEHPVLWENDTENNILYSDFAEHLDAALHKLPSAYAEAFHMSRLEAMNFQQIAEELGVSVRTIEVRIGKALVMLRRELKDYLSASNIITWFYLLSAASHVLATMGVNPV